MYFWIILMLLVVAGGIIHYKFPYFFRALRLTWLQGHPTASPYDLRSFPHRTVPRGDSTPWMKSSRYNTYQPSSLFRKKLKKMKTSALLVAQNGELLHEQYFGKHRERTVSNSFSIAKTVVALLAGKALEEGYLESWDQKISTIYPEYDYEPANRLTVRDLIRMSSGMDWNENYYHPFNVTTEAYYGNHLDKLVLSRKIESVPGEAFKYQSGNTQLLAMVLSKVLPDRLSVYLAEKFWKPMGMENAAYWSVDKSSGIEKGYCCLHATARDFLRLGQLFLQDGRWAGKPLISAEYLEMMHTPGFEESPQYGGGLWLDGSHRPPFYMMRGHLGQFVIVIPERELVICRLGRKCDENEASSLEVEDIYLYINGIMGMLQEDD